MRRAIHVPYTPPLRSRQRAQDQRGHDFLPIFINGGIGDLLVSLPWIETFRESPIPIKIFTSYPDVADIFIKWAEIRMMETAGNYPFHILCADTPDWKAREIDIKTMCPFLRTRYEVWQSQQARWKFAIEGHPHRGNDMARLAVKLGLRRWTLPFEFIGMPYKDFAFDKASLGYRSELIGIDKPFITVHNGFDTTHKFSYSMKSWKVEYWKEFVAGFKRKSPHINIIQLGAGKDISVEGVDYCLVGKTPFQWTMRYLDKSLLHIDTDSGLVHARRLLGHRSVVLFGPTNVEYFGYPENINLKPQVCGDCWWMKPTWMKECVLAHDRPLCMDSIKPEMVLHAFPQFL